MDLFSGQLQSIKNQFSPEQQEKFKESGEHFLRHLPEDQQEMPQITAEIYNPAAEFDEHMEYSAWLVEGIKCGLRFEDLDETDQQVLRATLAEPVLNEILGLSKE